MLVLGIACREVERLRGANRVEIQTSPKRSDRESPLVMQTNVMNAI